MRRRGSERPSPWSPRSLAGVTEACGKRSAAPSQVSSARRCCGVMPVGDRLLGVFVAQLVEAEAAALDDFEAARDRVLVAAEQPRHLLRRLQMALGIGGEAIAGLARSCSARGCRSAHPAAAAARARGRARRWWRRAAARSPSPRAARRASRRHRRRGRDGGRRDRRGQRNPPRRGRRNPRRSAVSGGRTMTIWPSPCATRSA